MSVIRAEEPGNGDLLGLVEQAWAPIMSYIVDRSGEGDPAQRYYQSLSGAAWPTACSERMHNTSLRASWDDTFTREDMMTTHLWLYLLILAGLGGEVDIDARVARYTDLIKEDGRAEAGKPTGSRGIATRIPCRGAQHGCI